MNPSDIPDRLQQALGTSYVIERELGRGGMATVYLARDLKHDRLVALKVLHPHLAATLGPQRFLREIKLAARLQHPHILSVHDSGEAAAQDGAPKWLWFTMPYVEGESLRERLRREGQLPVEEALRITREAAQALDYAHQHDVIHRDIKPENILLTGDGNVLVADFGIARAVGGGEDGTPGRGEDPRLTETGMSLGTPAYMSPEQVAAERTVDARTDIYSLGSVLYEMLSGEPPFTGPTAQAIMAKRLSSPAPSVRIVRPDVPEAVDVALTTALARAPAGRYASAGQFAAALKAPLRSRSSDTRRIARFSALIIGLLLLAAAAWTVLQRGSDSRPATLDSRLTITRLAVLPFDNLGDSSDGYFAEGVSDEVRGKLANLSGIEVIARTSSSQYRGTTKPAQQIARELGVRYLLTGTVRWDKRPGSSRVRVSPELVDAGTGATKWQKPFDAALTDVFQVQGEIAGRVAEELNVALGTSEREALATRPTRSLEAYDAFLRGEATTRRLTVSDAAALRRALPSYETAVRLDSGFALAWSRISRIHSTIFFFSSSDPADSAAAEQAARRAIAVSPNLPDAWVALGNFYYRVAANPRRAVEQFRKGLALAPGDATLLGAMSRPEAGLGLWESAATHSREALRLDPRSYQAAIGLTRSLITVRRWDEALAAADAAIRLEPSVPDAVRMKAEVYAAQGDLQGAREVYRNAPRELDRATLVANVAHIREMAWTLGPDDIDLLASLPPEAFAGERADWGLALMQAWALKGDTARARMFADTTQAAFTRMVSRSGQNSQDYALLGLSLAYLGRYDQAVASAKKALSRVGPEQDQDIGGYNLLQLARIYAIAGRRDQAIETLERLIKNPVTIAPGWLRIDPTFASLRNDPRFQRLVSG